MSGTQSDTAGDRDTEDVLERLQAARENYEAARDRVEAVGESTLRRVAEAHREATRLLDGYQDSATGTGDFAAYVEFQEEIGELTEGLPEDLPERSAFEDAADRLGKRRLTERDFEHARETLEPAGDLAVRLEECDAARERYRRARRAVAERRDALDAQVADLRAVARWSADDLEAPVEELREPVEAYNEAVASAFETFRREASARRVLRVVRAADAYPLVPLGQPPAALVEYVEDRPAGEEPVPTLLAHADRSVRELEHYVEEPPALKRTVGTNRTYLRSLDAAPLTVEWPPPERRVLRWRLEEVGAVVGRFAPDEVVERLRALREYTRDPEPYERLRRAARADASLSAADRERVAAGTVEADLERLRERRDRLEAALSDAPDPA